jgi:hypothetical protein
MPRALSSVMENTLLKRSESFFQPPQARFLRRWEEILMIGFPWLGIILSGGLWVLGEFGIQYPIGDKEMLLATIFLMDGVHIIFSFMLMASVPEMRAWSKSDSTRAKSGWMKGLRPGARSLVIAVALGVIMYLMKVSPATSSLRGMATTWLFLELLGPAQHTIAQMRGISLCYNSSIRRNQLGILLGRHTHRRCRCGHYRQFTLFSSSRGVAQIRISFSSSTFPI